MIEHGTLALMGSGETSSQGRKIHDYLMSRILAAPVRVAMLETPAGFQPNVDTVYRKIGEFFEKSLQNFRPQVEYVGDSEGNPTGDWGADAESPLTRAQYIFSGPGSPTYAARALSGTRKLEQLVEAYRSGATVVLSSAAAIAAGSSVMRVYEIFKAGADLGWDGGLHLLDIMGLGIDPVIITHWNNREGGAELDTSHCYVGAERFERLVEMLPPGTPILGIDEHTACIFEAGSETVAVRGAGTATVINNGEITVTPAGASFPLKLLRAALPVEA